MGSAIPSPALPIRIGIGLCAAGARNELQKMIYEANEDARAKRNRERLGK